MDVLAFDYLENAGGANLKNSPFVGAPFNRLNWPQYPDKGICVLFTDGSAKYIQFNSDMFNLITKYLTTTESKTTMLQYNTIMNYFQDHIR